MKTPSDNIYKLIRSMSAAEKRYFKRHYSSEKSLLTELFDFINGMEQYDELQIKAHFQSSNLSKNLKVYKVQLFDLLMKSLTSHHNKKNIKSKIRMGLEEVEVLIEKELFNFAQTRLKKLKHICLKYEEYAYLIPLLETEYQLENFYTVNIIHSDKTIQLKQIKEYTKILSNMFQLRSMYSSTIDQYNHRDIYELNETEVNQYQKFLDITLNKGQLEQKTVKEQIFTNQILANIEILLHQNTQKKNELLKDNLTLFSKHPHFKEAHPRYYFATLYNYLNSCCNLHYFDELEEGLIAIKNFVEKHPAIRRNLLFVYFLESRGHYIQGRYQYIAEELEELIQSHIERYDQENDFLSARIYTLLIHTHMVLENPQRGHYYLRRLQIITKQLDSAYIQYAQILELISHYDTNDFLIIEKIINSTKRKLKRNQDFTPFFLYFLETIEQLVKEGSKTPAPKIAREFAKKCTEFKSDPVLNLMREYTLEEWQKLVELGCSFAAIKRAD